MPLYSVSGQTMIQVIQITDTHISSDHEAILKGINPVKTLQTIVKKIKEDYPALSCLIVTGDLTQDKSTGSYTYLKELLSTINAPSYWLAGNHDQIDLMRAINPAAMQRLVDLGSWQVVLLNTQVTNKVVGYISDIELSFLDSCLSKNPTKHTLIALHHHPVPIQSTWMDRIMLMNPESLSEIILLHKNVKAIIHGHVHQLREYQFCNLPLMATPSTCVQFAPGTQNFYSR